MDSFEKNEKYRQMIEQNKRLRKKMLWILSAVLGIIVLSIALVVIFYFVSLPPKTDEDPREKIEFYPPYTGDIFESEEYLAFDRNVYYFDGYVRRSVEEEYITRYDGTVQFLYRFLETMTHGDTEAYNACFTKNPNVSEFSQQMIYEAEIEYLSDTAEANGDRVYTYCLKYKIHRNDGTLRDDVGSDGVIPQYAVLRLKPDGRITIDMLYTEDQREKG